MGYKLTNKADADLQRLYEWGLDNHGLEKANSYFDGIVERFHQIGRTPMMWQGVDHIRQGYRRSVFGVHSIYYHILDDKSVEIARILRAEDITQLHTDDLH